MGRALSEVESKASQLETALGATRQDLLRSQEDKVLRVKELLDDKQRQDMVIEDLTRVASMMCIRITAEANRRASAPAGDMIFLDTLGVYLKTERRLINVIKRGRIAHPVQKTVSLLAAAQTALDKVLKVFR